MAKTHTRKVPPKANKAAAGAQKKQYFAKQWILEATPRWRQFLGPLEPVEKKDGAPAKSARKLPKAAPCTRRVHVKSPHAKARAAAASATALPASELSFQPVQQIVQDVLEVNVSCPKPKEAVTPEMTDDMDEPIIRRRKSSGGMRKRGRSRKREASGGQDRMPRSSSRSRCRTSSKRDRSCESIPHPLDVARQAAEKARFARQMEKAGIPRVITVQGDGADSPERRDISRSRSRKHERSSNNQLPLETIGDFSSTEAALIPATEQTLPPRAAGDILPAELWAKAFDYLGLEEEMDCAAACNFFLDHVLVQRFRDASNLSIRLCNTGRLASHLRILPRLPLPKVFAQNPAIQSYFVAKMGKIRDSSTSRNGRARFGARWADSLAIGMDKDDCTIQLKLLRLDSDSLPLSQGENSFFRDVNRVRHPYRWSDYFNNRNECWSFSARARAKELSGLHLAKIPEIRAVVKNIVRSCPHCYNLATITLRMKAMLIDVLDVDLTGREDELRMLVKAYHDIHMRVISKRKAERLKRILRSNEPPLLSSWQVHLNECQESREFHEIGNDYMGIGGAR